MKYFDSEIWTWNKNSVSSKSKTQDIFFLSLLFLFLFLFPFSFFFLHLSPTLLSPSSFPTPPQLISVNTGGDKLSWAPTNSSGADRSSRCTNSVIARSLRAYALLFYPLFARPAFLQLQLGPCSHQPAQDTPRWPEPILSSSRRVLGAVQARVLGGQVSDHLRLAKPTPNWPKPTSSQPIQPWSSLYEGWPFCSKPLPFFVITFGQRLSWSKLSLCKRQLERCIGTYGTQFRQL